MSRLSNFFGRTNATLCQQDAGAAQATIDDSTGGGSGMRGFRPGLPPPIHSGHRGVRRHDESATPDLSIVLFKQDLKRWKRDAPAGEAPRRCEAVKRIEKTVANSQTYLNLNALQLSSLPPLHPWLKRLDISGNCLTDMPVLPEGLTMLNVSNNRLTALPPLLSGLTDLNVSGNQLSTLPPFPAGLKYVSVSRNQLTDLPELPAELLRLWAMNNLLSSLPKLPLSLIELQVSNNRLASVPNLPSELG